MTRNVLLLMINLIGIELLSGAVSNAFAITRWYTPATISFNLCQADEKFVCGPGIRSNNLKITWGGFRINPRKVVPDTMVTFGPFRIGGILNDLTDRGDVRANVEVTIKVMARSPALYDSAGNFLGADPNMRVIGQRVIQRWAEEGGFSEDVYVDVTLPSVFTSLRLDAHINVWGKTVASHFPYNCDSLPPSAAEPSSLDKVCMLVAVNPLMKLVPKVFPLAVIYDPPGNCSWANVTNTHTVGSGITLQQEADTVTKTIHDTSVLGFSIEHGEFTETKASATERKSTVRIKESKSLGTALGLPLESPGNPDCNRGVYVSPRENGGPGTGDLFVFLWNPCINYWHSENASNFLFSDGCPPEIGSATQLFPAYAWQIEKGEGLPAGVSFSEEEKRAILALDPLTDPTLRKLWEPQTTLEPTTAGTMQPPERPGAALPEARKFVPFEERILPKRLVPLNEIYCLSRGVPIEQSVERTQITVGDIKNAISSNFSGAPSTSEIDLPTKLLMKGLAYGGMAAAGAGVEAFGAWAAQAWGNRAYEKGFEDLADAVKDISIPLLYNDKTETRVVTTYSTNEAIDKSDDSAITQNYYLKDTNEAMNVALYYDLLYGTFAFIPKPQCSGALREKGFESLPIISWPIAVRAGEGVNIAIPDELSDTLTKLSWKGFETVLPKDYVVPRGFLKGALQGLKFDARTGRVIGKASAIPGQKSQTAIFAVDARGKRVAQLWINIEVIP